MNHFKRLFKHLFATRWHLARNFPQHSLQAIEKAIRESEKLHMGELRFVAEAGLEWPELFSGINSRERAVQIFSQLRIWDTKLNSGVLIYLLLADRKVEIVADRGITARVEQSVWLKICQDMENKFRIGEFESGVMQGIEAISKLLQTHYPAQKNNPNDLPDNAVIL
jgi:uncharacterized membrane protein